ncbi:MAG: mannose-1-phosphate guanylyltransferase [Anaerolineales bacterium]|jgi:mannose-1-phosphate guanylyltransferase
MSEHYYAVIMAGGGGTRLWPLSRRDKPKQMLRLDGERSLFEIAVDRLLGLFPADHIMVVTSAAQAETFQQEIPDIPAENYVIEPAGRDTAAAIGLAAVAIKQHDPDAIMAVVTADHYIEREGRFLHVLRAAEQVAAEGYLVTLGIQPTYPSTGFGYIQQGSYLGTHENIVVFNALSFKEKPDAQTAVEFIEAEDHSWNSGMFIWQVERILGEIALQMPQLHQALDRISASWGQPDYENVLQQVWQPLKKISIDFGIMEGAEKVAVIPARGLGWSDVGSWNAVFDVLPKSAEENAIICRDYISEDTRNTLVFAKEGSERLIVTLGIADLVIVDSGDVLLVCNKEHAQDVRGVVDQLTKEGKISYL